MHQTPSSNYTDPLLRHGFSGLVQGLLDSSQLLWHRELEKWKTGAINKRSVLHCLQCGQQVRAFVFVEGCTLKPQGLMCGIVLI